MENFDKEDLNHSHAKSQVKKMKGFYIHALIYTLVNAGLFIINHSNGTWKIGDENNYYSAFFWGLGLVAHGLSVFLPDLLLGKKWEERKIQQLMDRNKNLKQ